MAYTKNTNKEYEIEKFTYNGFFVTTKPGLAKYKAKFNKWTDDPGVVLMDCSDGKQRLIPTCCVVGGNDFPKQEIKMNEKTALK